MNEQILAQLKASDPEQRKQGIAKLARSNDPDALRWLANLYKNDPDAEVRKLALQAGKYLRQRQHGSPQSTMEVAAVAAENTQRARYYCRSAVKALMEDDRAGAVQALGRALDLDPNLTGDVTTLNLAADITGLEPDRAMELLSNPVERATIYRMLGGGDSSNEGRQTTIRLALFAGVVMLSVGIFLLATTGVLDDIILNFERQRWSAYAQVINDNSVYLVVPDVAAPDDGWRVLVALHGNNGTSLDMVQQFGEAVLADEAILVAPAFADYEPPYDLSISVLAGIVTDVTTDLPINQDQIVLYGTGAGGNVAVAYADSAPERVAAVSVSNPAEFTPGDTTAVRYLVTVADDDDDLSDLSASISTLEAEGYSITMRVVEPDEQSEESTSGTLSLLRDAYQPQE